MNEQPNIHNAIENAQKLVSLLHEAKNIVYELGTNSPGESEKEKKEIPSVLSKRQKEIWELFRDGLNVTQISEKLKVAEKTVEVHRDQIRKKLGLKSAKEFYELVNR